MFWTLPSTYLTGASAAAGIALVNTGAALGGFVSPSAIGLIRQAGGGYALGLAGLGVTSLVVAVIAATMRIDGLPVTAATASLATTT